MKGLKRDALVKILAQLPDCLLVIDRECRIRFVNDEFSRLFGLQPDPLLGQNFKDYFPESTLTDLWTKPEPRVIKVGIGKDWFLANHIPIFIGEKMEFAATYFQKITILEETLNRLREKEDALANYEFVFENAYDGVIVVDREGYVTKITDAYCRFLKITREQALGRHVTEVLPNSRMHIVAQTGKPEIGELMKIKGQDAVVMRVPIYREGQIIGALGLIMFKNIAELKNLAQKLNIMQSKLEFYQQELCRIRKARYSFDNILGNSEPIQKARELACKAAQTRTTVLILGESGTGKELFAQAIHQASPRNKEAFVQVNCASIPKELLEAELFGYEEGAFTGAKKGGKAGKIELADKGTLFLDEIGDMPLNMQAKLLRVLQEKEVERVGGNRVRPVDIRVIAATNKDLRKLVEKGEFREDLFYRLHVLVIHIPSLRERKEDIPLVARSLLKRFNNEMGKAVSGLTEEVEELFQQYHWPGNIRELGNVIERAMVVVEGDLIRYDDLPLYFREWSKKDRGGKPQESFNMEEVEKQMIKEALQKYNGSITLTARALGIHRTTLYRKLRRYNL